MTSLVPSAANLQIRHKVNKLDDQPGDYKSQMAEWLEQHLSDMKCAVMIWKLRV